ncbi:MAG: cytochrome c biogenesis protein CcdA [Actinomycetota bacterium]
MGEARRSAPFAVLALATVAVALLGYVGYLLYPRFDLPAGTGASLLLLSAAAGVASFFSPCGFPLLVTVLARDTATEEHRLSLARALRFGAWLSLGAASFVLLLGSLIALGAGTFFRTVTFTSTEGIVLRSVVGALLILLGLIQLNVIPSAAFGAVERGVRPLIAGQARLRRERPPVGFAVLGFGYLLAGFG